MTTPKPTEEMTTPKPTLETKKTESYLAPESKQSAELFGKQLDGDKAELLKALKKLEEL